MSEPAAGDALSPDVRLDALRAQGAALCEPAHWRYIEALARRWHEVPEPALRAVLGASLQAALSRHATRMAAAQGAALHHPVPAAVGGVAMATGASRDAGVAHGHEGPGAHSVLADLNRYIAEAQRAHRLRADGDAVADRLSGDEPDDPSEMKSLRRFRHTWAQLASEQQVAQALASGPDNAGPLNSQRLVIRTLALLRELSPDYLRRFVSQVDVLLWLDQVNQKLALASSKPAAKNAAGKPTAPKGAATKRSKTKG